MMANNMIKNLNYEAKATTINKTTITNQPNHHHQEEEEGTTIGEQRKRPPLHYDYHYHSSYLLI